MLLIYNYTILLSYNVCIKDLDSTLVYVLDFWPLLATFEPTGQYWKLAQAQNKPNKFFEIPDAHNSKFLTATFILIG